MVIMSVILLLCILEFYKVLFNNGILVHYDLRFGLTAYEQLRYNILHINVQGPKIPIILLTYLFSTFIGSIISLKLILPLCLFIACILVYNANKGILNLIFKKCYGEETWKYNPLIVLSSFIGTLIFIYNPWTIINIHHHVWPVIADAAIYLAIVQIDKFLWEDRKLTDFVKRSLIISFLFMLMATQPQFVLAYFPIVFSLYICVYIIVCRGNFIRRLLSKRIMILLIIIILINAFWLLPSLVSLLIGVHSPATYAIVEENLKIMSHRANIANVVLFANSYVWEHGYTVNFDLRLDGINIWCLSSPLLFALAGLSSLMLLRTVTKNFSDYQHNEEYRKLSLVLFVLLLFIGSIIFATGSYYSLIGNIIMYIFLKTPLGWCIRNPYNADGLVLISLVALNSMFIALSYREFGKKRLKVLVILIIVIVILATLLWGWPALTGNLNNHLKVLPYPKSLYSIITNLSKFRCKTLIMWFPESSLSQRNCLKYEDIPEISIAQICFQYPSPLEYDKEFVEFINYIIADNLNNIFSKVIEKLDIGYIVVRKDIRKCSPLCLQLSNLVNKLRKILERTNYIIYCKNISDDLFIVYKVNLTNLSYFRTYGYITYTTTPDLLFEFSFNNCLPFLFPVNNLYFELGKIVYSPLRKYIITIKPIHYKPSQYWSLGYFQGGWLKDINLFLDKMRIQIWDTNYGLPVLFTYARFRIPITKLKLNSAKLVSIENLSLKRSLPVSVKLGHIYYLTINLHKYNKSKLCLSILEFSSKMKYISKLIKCVTNIHKNREGFYIVITNPLVKYIYIKPIKLSNLSGIEGDIRVYDITNIVLYPSISTEFQVNSAGYYYIIVRYLCNRKGGIFRVLVDNRVVAYLISKDDINEFNWKIIGPIYLNKGPHKLTFENIVGFNGIGVVIIIPKKKFEHFMNLLISLLNQSNIFYMFSASYNMHIHGRYKRYTRWLLLYPGSYIWHSITILKRGEYYIDVELEGKAQICISNECYITDEKYYKLIKVGPYNLFKHRYMLIIKNIGNKRLRVGRIILYSATKTLSMRGKQATILKVIPYEYKIILKINASKPFLLLTHIGYNPLIKAYVYKNNKLLKVISPLPVYELINGYWIPVKGLLRIVIINITYPYFKVGIYISSFTIVILVVILIILQRFR